MNIRRITFFFLLCPLIWAAAKADDFFQIEGTHYYAESPSDGSGAYSKAESVDANNQKINQLVFQPCLKVRLRVKNDIRSDAICCRAYFYDSTRQLMASVASPSASEAKGEPFLWPVIIGKDSDETIYFVLPDKVKQSEDWSAVVVFGDDKGVDASLYQDSEGGEIVDYDFPEKKILEDKNGPDLERKPPLNLLLEHVVQTYNQQQPQITLFLRPPFGVTDASQAKGVLCLSLLADNVDGVRRQLQGLDPNGEVSGMLRFAQSHQLIIICWGSSSLWDSTKNWDDLDPDVAWQTDRTFDQVSTAWARGIDYFVKEYGIPDKNYLLWGVSGSAQYACRLALRKPEYFLAVHIHIPSSFDKPTEAANKVLWCLTTGELESGYQRSLRFYEQCCALGYPIIYKAIEGLGHDGSPIADAIGEKFFEYALSVRDQRIDYDRKLADPLDAFDMSQTQAGDLKPWLPSFRQPTFMGDIMNQDVFPYDQRSMIPTGFQVPLPTQAIANAWNQ